MASSSSSSSPEICHSDPAFDPSFFSYASLNDVLEELSTRFIMNLPDQELKSVERMCFQVEQAHWYYEDFMREANPKLPPLSLKRFSSIFFNSCPLLRQWSAEHEQYFNTFMQYKVRVPVCGAIMLNDKWDKCILVKGWKSSAGWGFPKGKINQNEPAHECAAREVAEETGFNITPYLRREDYIEMTIREQRVTLFIVSGIPEDYPFQTRTRKEISKIQWFKLLDLPSWKRNKQVPGKFYLISPFVHALKEFIRVNKPARRRQNRQKSGVEPVSDFTVSTIPGEEDANEDSEQHERTAIRAVSLDRDANGYSSSSVDNCEPQTPSPQAPETLPVTTEVDAEGKPGVPLDPHFARLLNGLTLSASKPVVNGELEIRASSVTPTSAQSSLSSVGGECGNTLKQSIVFNDEEERSSVARSVLPSERPASSNVKSPSDSARSGSSAMTVRPQSAQPMSSAMPLQTLATDRHLKHLALLETVAQEAAASTSTPVMRQIAPPGPPLSVPPMPFNPPSLPSVPTAAVPTKGGHNPAPFRTASRFALPAANDPFSTRPMTSQALFSPSSSSPSIRRHGPNLSVQQDSLLSILSGSSNIPTDGPNPHRPMQRFGTVNGPGFMPCAGRSAHPPALIPSSKTQALAPQPLRVMQPPPGSFQLNPGPLTAPLRPPGHVQPFFAQPGSNSIFNSHKVPSTNAEQLLSLLNSSTGAHDLLFPVVDSTRPNSQTGSSH